LDSFYNQSDKDIAVSSLNATIANLSVNLVILGHIQEQIRLQKESMAKDEKFQRELLQMLDTIIKNQ